MPGQYLKIEPEIYQDINANLFSETDEEKAAFIFARREYNRSSKSFKAIEWYKVPEKGYIRSSLYYLELTDNTRAHVIKRAHDLDASLVELHSHPVSDQAQFSESDFQGFNEFVPHVWWRLDNRPYIALVFTQKNFDGLVWLNDPYTPQQLDGLKVGKEIIAPTKLTLNLNSDHV